MLVFTLLFSLVGLTTYGQSTILKSAIDNSVTVKTVTIAPFQDNVSQIYGKPLTGQMKAIVESDRQWDLRTFPDTIKNTPEEFEDQPSLVKAALKKAGTDAMITARVTKGPQGVNIRMNLFLANDGLVFVQESLQDFSGFEITDLRNQLELMFKKMKSRMPYAGFVMSRKGQLVTMNVGKNHGVREGMDLSVIQMIKLNRHPKFKFLISAEKEIIGRIKLDKVEEALSFGTLTLERSENVVQPGMKVMTTEFVEYPATPVTGDGKILDDLGQRPDSQVAFGNGQPREWVPETTPSFGKVGVMLGIGSYAISNTLRSVGGVDGSSNFTPSIHLDGELWLTRNWFMSLGLKQFVSQISNGYPGSSPGKINVSSMQTTLQAGYSFLMADQFYGPKIQVLGGYSKMQATVDDSSPTAFTSMNFGGMALGLAGSFPVSEETPITLGAKLMYYLTTSVDESPVSSGSSSSAKISTFSGFGTYKYTEHINLRGEIMYDLFSASFSGTGSRGADSATSASHTLTTVAAGVEYLF